MKKLHERYLNVKLAKVSCLLIFILAIAFNVTACGQSDDTDLASVLELEAEGTEEEVQEQLQESEEEKSPTEEQLEEILLMRLSRALSRKILLIFQTILVKRMPY